MAAPPADSAAAAAARAAGFAANESCALIDTLFAVAEAGGCKFAFDARATVSLCRATAVKSHVVR